MTKILFISWLELPPRFVLIMHHQCTIKPCFNRDLGNPHTVNSHRSPGTRNRAARWAISCCTADICRSCGAPQTPRRKLRASGDLRCLAASHNARNFLSWYHGADCVKGVSAAFSIPTTARTPFYAGPTQSTWRVYGTQCCQNITA